MEAGTPDLIKLEDLDAAAGTLTGRKHVLSILVENRPGVLARIAGLFSRRGFNIDTLAVGPTIVDVSRRSLTIEVTGSSDKVEAFERMIRPHGLIEMVRTGEVAIARAKSDS